MSTVIVIGLILLFCFSVVFRTIVCNPISTVKYSIVDFMKYLKYKQWRDLKSGFIICFVGLFGKGKTLASVHYVLTQYKKYNDKKVFDFNRKKWVTQKVLVLSNVDLSIPFVKFTGLQQIIDISKKMRDIDEKNDTLTITLVLGDEFSVQLNSRQFKTNIDPLFLNTLLTCRHHHISIIYNAQRFGHVDALLRQVTSYVVDCNKVWRIMVHAKYDAWDLENATSPSMCKPLLRYGWFIRKKDFEAYDTLACVDNLIKSSESGDMLSEDEILTLQNNIGSDMDVVKHTSRRYKRNMKRTHK